MILKADELSNTDEIEVGTDEEEKSVFMTEYVVTAEKAVVRSGRGSEYAIIKTLRKGYLVKVYSVKNGWAKVKVENKTGYIVSKNIKKLS